MHPTIASWVRYPKQIYFYHDPAKKSGCMLVGVYFLLLGFYILFLS